MLVVIILMAILFGAELGPKADPTTTTYSPRPEWYFFFLFELLRVVKPPALVFVATIGIPTICLMLLILLPFYDRSPERHPLKRPIAMVAAVATVGAMAYLTILGAIAGPPSEIELERRRRSTRRARQVTASSGCLGCHKIGENGNTLGPNLTEIGDRLGKDAIARTLVNPTSPMPSYDDAARGQPGAVRPAGRLRRLAASEDMPEDASRRRSSPRSAVGAPDRDAAGDAGAGDVRPHRARLRPA